VKAAEEYGTSGTMAKSGKSAKPASPGARQAGGDEEA